METVFSCHDSSCNGYFRTGSTDELGIRSRCSGSRSTGK